MKIKKAHIPQNQRGFTLIETAATLAIITFLGALLVQPTSNIPELMEKLRVIYKTRADSLSTIPDQYSDQTEKAGFSLENRELEVLKSPKPSDPRISVRTSPPLARKN